MGAPSSAALRVRSPNGVDLGLTRLLCILRDTPFLHETQIKCKNGEKVFAQTGQAVFVRRLSQASPFPFHKRKTSKYKRKNVSFCPRFSGRECFSGLTRCQSFARQMGPRSLFHGFKSINSRLLAISVNYGDCFISYLLSHRCGAGWRKGSEAWSG